MCWPWNHRWDIIDVVDVFAEETRNVENRMPLYKNLILQCTKCGMVKRKNLR